MNTGDVRTFFDAWSLYDRVLDRNYMFHDEIYRDVVSLVRSRFRPGDYRILDLGCGSARHIAGVLKAHPASVYVGFDLSVVALGHARASLGSAGCPADLRQADLFDGLCPGGEPFDLIFSAFAVHHLSTEDKERLFQRARARLAPGGVLLLVDTSRAAGEDLPSYLENYGGWIRSDWCELSSEDQDHILDHIRTSDFPETSETIHAMASSAGFDRVTDVNQHRWHRTWQMEVG